MAGYPSADEFVAVAVEDTNEDDADIGTEEEVAPEVDAPSARKTLTPTALAGAAREPPQHTPKSAVEHIIAPTD